MKMPEMPMSYEPIMICAYGSSFHRNATDAHIAASHGTSWAAAIRMATREEHQRAGWGTAGYPERITA
jgi:hypothetical protein